MRPTTCGLALILVLSTVPAAALPPGPFPLDGVEPETSVLPFGPRAATPVVEAAAGRRRMLVREHTGTAEARDVPWVVGYVETSVGRLWWKTARGPALDAEARTPDRRHEMDVCLAAESGRPFFRSYGGDNVLIPECEPVREAGMRARSAEERRRRADAERARRRANKALVREAAALVEHLTLAEPFREEARAVGSLLRVLATYEPSARPPAAKPEVTARSTAGATGFGYDQCTSPDPVEDGCIRHLVEIWVGDASYSSGWSGNHPFAFQLGEHSATWAWSFDALYEEFVWEWTSNNHGRGPGDGGMYHACDWWSNWIEWWEIPYRATCDHVGGTYGFTSTNGGHNCNDDSYVNLISASAGQIAGTAVCTDSWVRKYHPACSGEFGYCSGCDCVNY